jgi:sortase (surface protein transpeptidase)
MSWFEIYIVIGLIYLSVLNVSQFISSLSKNYIEKERRLNLFYFLIGQLVVVIFYPIVTLGLFFVLHQRIQEDRYTKKVEKEIRNLPEFKKFHEQIKKSSEKDESL